MTEIRCPKCGLVVGDEVELEGLTLLRAGIIAWDNASGLCTNCGNRFHWHVSDRMMAKILARAQEHRKPVL